MAGDSETSGERGGRAHAWLPFLTGALLALLLVWFVVWFLFQRPTTEEELQVSAFGAALRYIPTNYVEEVDRTELFRAAMKGMVESLGDRYSGYVTPSERQHLHVQTEGEFGGIGVTITQSDGLPLIVEVHEDAPAGRAGIERGDLITHVDEEDIAGLRLDQVVARIRGEVGTDVALKLRRPATGDTPAVTLTREKISMPNVRWEMLDDGIGLIRLVSFDKDCAREIEQALNELQEAGLKGLILDLRNNSGGLVDQAVLVCDMFLSDGVVLNIRGRDPAMNESWKASPAVGLDAAVPMTVLVDERTASAAEILAGAVQVNGRGTVIGTKTIGKGAVTNLRFLPDGSGLVLTVAHYELAEGQEVEGVGIQPDLVVGELLPFPGDEDPEKVKAWIEEFKKAKKEQFEKAVEFLGDKTAGQ